MKLGLANLMIVIALYKMSLKETYLLSITRVVLSGFLFGNMFAILYSLAGGLLSLTVMAVLKKAGGFSVMGVSIAGGVFHNIGQLIIAMIVVETFSVAYYIPVLLIAGVITGLFAQGMDAFGSACLGVFLHACGGDEQRRKRGIQRARGRPYRRDRKCIAQTGQRRRIDNEAA